MSSRTTRSRAKASESPPEVLHINLETETKDNDAYRNVIYTLPDFQLVLMSLKPGEEIGMEIHNYNTQFFRCESGSGIIQIRTEQEDNYLSLFDGVAVCVPSGTWHNIKNTSKTEYLKLYTIYVPPHHPPDRYQKYHD